MKLLAGMFGAIALLAALPGFATDVAPAISLFGKLAALIAMAGLAIIAGTSVLQDELRDEFPPFDFEADSANRP